MDNDKQTKQKKLLIVIVNYYSSSLVNSLARQLESLIHPENFRISITCTDNSCSNEENIRLKEIAESTSLPLKIEENSENFGYGKAINMAAKDFDYLLCLNPDVYLHKNSLKSLLAHADANSTQGIWGGITLDDQGSPDYRHAWQEPNLINTMAWAFGIKKLVARPSLQDNYRHISSRNKRPYSVDSVSGSFLLISHEAWQKTGMFDTDFFLYSEEIDLCRRARKLGFQPTVVPSATLRHAHHSKNEFLERVHTIYLSKLIYAQKHHNNIYNIFYRFALIIGSLIRIIGALPKQNMRAIKAWGNLIRLAFSNQKYNTNSH